MIKYVLKRLIKIYTPFVCAVIALIHGVLFLCEYSGSLFTLFSEFSGHSILLVLYIISTSSKMCIWYKTTNWILFSTHVINIAYLYDILQFYEVIWMGVILNILALLTFLIYRVSVDITKFLC